MKVKPTGRQDQCEQTGSRLGGQSVAASTELEEGEGAELDERADADLALTPAEPSETAQRVRRLQRAVLDAASRRKRLPQPLFWSLFHTELEEIRRAKERKRILSKIVS